MDWPWPTEKTAPPLGKWFDWSVTAKRMSAAIEKSWQCVRKVAGKNFLNAYVGSEDKPPESMVQAAVEVTLCEYEAWQLAPHPLMRRLEGNLSAFFLKNLGTMARWLPARSSTMRMEAKSRRPKESTLGICSTP
jgi:hypothetical protein